MAERQLAYRRIMVTGAGGFVGRRLINRLRDRLAEDAVVYEATRSNPVLPGHRRIDLDITDREQVSTVIGDIDPDCVLHLAGQSSISQRDVEAETWQVNTAGTINLAAAIVAQPKPADILFTSSAEVYGTAFNQGDVTEETVPAPLSVYGRSKLAAEQALGDILAKTSARIIIARPSNHSGPGQDERFVIPSFAAQIARSEAGHTPPIIDVGNLEAERDFLDVRDIVDGYLALLCSSPAEKGPEIYNLASGSPISIQTVVDRLRGMAKLSVTLRQSPDRMRPSEIPHVSMNSDRARKSAGWAPRYSLDDMLADVFQAARQTAANVAL